MKLRKLFAGVAAAATLLGGMAFGATTANAADTASITLSDKTVKGTVYTAYKIGSYDTASAKVENDKLASVGVTTDQAWKTDAENVLGTTVTNTPEYKGYGDPLAYVAGTTGYYTNTPGMLPNASATMESFVQGLTGRLDGKTAVDPSQTVANDNDDVVFSGLDEGLYLIVSKTDTEPVTDAGSPLAIVGTRVTVDGTDNDVRFDNSNQTATTTITPKLNTVTFTKKGVDADASALKGVVFQIVADANNATPLPDGTVTEATSGDNGVVTFSGLPNGTYTITEKTPADGYLTTALPSFTVTVENGKVTNVTPTGVGAGLVTFENGYANIVVKNVKKITQLPLTGAAGTALFTVVAVLLAGVAATVFAKSRSTKRAPNA